MKCSLTLTFSGERSELARKEWRLGWDGKLEQ
jgi:hypothetical protein